MFKSTRAQPTSESASNDGTHAGAGSAPGAGTSYFQPLKVDGKVFAALTLYAEQPNAFDKEEVAPLVALTDDISYAVSQLRQRAAKNGATPRATT